MSPEAPYYDLYCRGPLELHGPNDPAGTPGVLIAIDFARNPSDAGTDGKQLKPGTAAFVDRPVSSDEPTRIHVAGLEPVGFGDTASQDLRSLATQLHLLARYEREAVLLSNLLTRSDYVSVLKVQNIQSIFYAALSIWDQAPAYITRYIPLVAGPK